jgi:endonuclease/exonuclease/phosphatase family metal-dependent hydrolase
MTISGRLALLLTASVVGAGLTATTTTAASAATTSRADAVGLTTSVAATTTGCAAKAVAQRDATTYSSLAPKALIGVASYNIQGQHASGWTNWPGRRDALATQIANCRPDVIGVQEAAESWVWETNSSSSSRRISQYENLTDEVNERTVPGGDTYVPTNRYRLNCSSTPEWNGTYLGRTAVWHQCHDGATKGSSDNRILYNATTVKVLSQGFGNLTSPTSTRRTVAWAVVEQRATQRRFFIANTHLDSSVSTATRITQMKQALAVIAKARVYGGVALPTFVLGDLNSSRYTEGTTAADTLTSAGYIDIVGNDRRTKASGNGVGWCRRRQFQAASIPGVASTSNPRPQDRFVNVVYNTSNRTTFSCTYPEGNTSKPRLASSEWWKYNGSAIDYIFVSYTVRARTWETVVPAASTNGIAKSPPSDHNMIMTWAYV